ncbi:hypothetical protein LOK74_08800 [Brevibacillus humidisoli]|uniref:hypothetical protein n=1 Tax=Brevibacillus humidisoli TaxID=2895522 RepID=UPI001E4A4420|nr:hypothetical protein [Brevibacillus humidisoli]UFJ42572.1 hypothetical protein LOK74_08800 [Brevibacillus humidisoli]
MNTAPCEEKIYRYWWFHDGAWYQNVARKFGFEAANELNKEALRYMAKRGMQTYVRENGIDLSEITTIESLAHHYMEGASEMWPEHWVHLEANILGPDSFEVVNRRNFAIEMLRKAGTLDKYECPGLALREGWFAGLGIKNYIQEERECVVRGDEVCRYWARIDFAGGER